LIDSGADAGQTPRRRFSSGIVGSGDRAGGEGVDEVQIGVAVPGRILSRRDGEAWSPVLFPAVGEEKRLPARSGIGGAGTAGGGALGHRSCKTCFWPERITFFGRAGMPAEGSA